MAKPMVNNSAILEDLSSTSSTTDKNNLETFLIEDEEYGTIGF